MSDKMNPEAKKLWIEALRSGKYVQGIGALHDVKNNTWCCLGVLCDVAEKAGIKVDHFVSFDGNYESFERGDSLLISYEGNVCQWAKIPVSGINLDNDPFYNLIEDLAELNDTGYSFSEIADIIEKEL